MTALERLLGALEPLRLYALRTDSLVDRELRAYAAGLEIVCRRMEAVLAAAFVQTAAGCGLDAYEALAGSPPRGDLDDDDRRALLLHRLGGAPFDSTPPGIVRCLRAVGLEAEVEQDPAGECLTVRCRALLDPSLDRRRLEHLVNTVMPAHLDFTLVDDTRGED